MTRTSRLLWNKPVYGAVDRARLLIDFSWLCEFVALPNYIAMLVTHTNFWSIYARKYICAFRACRAQFSDFSKWAQTPLFGNKLAARNMVLAGVPHQTHLFLGRDSVYACTDVAQIIYTQRRVSDVLNVDQYLKRSAWTHTAQVGGTLLRTFTRNCNFGVRVINPWNKCLYKFWNARYSNL